MVQSTNSGYPEAEPHISWDKIKLHSKALRLKLILRFVKSEDVILKSTDIGNISSIYFILI